MQITPALGTNIKDCSSDILFGRKWRVSEKIDGVRRLFWKDDNGNVKAFSRTGKEDIWLKHITEFLEAPWFPYNRVYDCELVDRKLYFERVPSFILRSESAGKANQQFSTYKTELVAICFDIYTPGDLDDGFSRDLELRQLFIRQPLTDPMIMVPIFGIIDGSDDNTSSLLRALMDQIEGNNGEGLMLMDLAQPYIPGRSKNLLKVKHSEEYVGTIVDVEMGKEGTKIEGMVSALICKVEECTVPVRVGSGMTNIDRVDIKHSVEKVIGTKIEIEAFSKTRDVNGNVSLSMPIFKRFLRNDLDEND